MVTTDDSDDVHGDELAGHRDQADHNAWSIHLEPPAPTSVDALRHRPSEW
jgi:hypothetical protein